jgi:hypothetical protein
MSNTEHSVSRHHPSWRELRDTFLADQDVHQAYQALAPRFAVVAVSLDDLQPPWRPCSKCFPSPPATPASIR